jgi:hypothetical protein
MSDPGNPFPQPAGSPRPWTGPAAAGQPSPPMYPPPAPPYRAPPVQKRRRSRWLTVGLPLGVLLVLGGCGTVAVLAVYAFTGSLGPAMEVGGAYAGALVDQRWDDAHAMLCDEARAAVTAEQLAARYGGPPLTGYSVEGAYVGSSGGHTSGEVTVRFLTEDGLDELTVVPLVRDGDDWRPCP